jgi:hypothetical protein
MFHTRQIESDEKPLTPANQFVINIVTLPDFACLSGHIFPQPNNLENLSIN